MLDYSEKLPSKIPVIIVHGGLVSISSIKVRYRSEPPKSKDCHCFGHAMPDCYLKRRGATSSETADIGRPTYDADNPLCQDKGKVVGRKNQGIEEKKPLKPTAGQPPTISYAIVSSEGNRCNSGIKP